MSDIINDGGPAFPCPSGSDGGSLYDGMTLRDWFAGQALQGILSNPFMVEAIFKQKSNNAQDTAKEIIEQAWASSDAMLAQREKKP